MILTAGCGKLWCRWLGWRGPTIDQLAHVWATFSSTPNLAAGSQFQHCSKSDNIFEREAGCSGSDVLYTTSDVSYLVRDVHLIRHQGSGRGRGRESKYLILLSGGFGFRVHFNFISLYYT